MSKHSFVFPLNWAFLLLNDWLIVWFCLDVCIHITIHVLMCLVVEMRPYASYQFAYDSLSSIHWRSQIYDCFDYPQLSTYVCLCCPCAMADLMSVNPEPGPQSVCCCWLGRVLVVFLCLILLPLWPLTLLWVANELWYASLFVQYTLSWNVERSNQGHFPRTRFVSLH